MRAQAVRDYFMAVCDYYFCWSTCLRTKKPQWRCFCMLAVDTIVQHNTATERAARRALRRVRSGFPVLAAFLAAFLTATFFDETGIRLVRGDIVVE